jgi:hypothetical protein
MLADIFCPLPYQLCHQPCPTGLMACSQSGPILTLKVFVEQDQVTPVRVFLEYLRATIYRPSPGTIPQENAYQSLGQLHRYFPESHLFTRACRTLHCKFITQVTMELLERLDNQVIHGEPHRTTPVRVAPKITCPGFCRFVIYFVWFSMLISNSWHDEGMFFVKFRNRTDSVRTQKFAFVQHFLKRDV